MDFKTYYKVLGLLCKFLLFMKYLLGKISYQTYSIYRPSLPCWNRSPVRTYQRNGDTIKNSTRASNIYDDIVIVITVVDDPDFEEFFSLSTLA